MRLLIVTQKVDESDSNLGFFVRWIEEFAKHCERVLVVCLEKGEYRLPGNVAVFSLGKEKLKITPARRLAGGLAGGDKGLKMLSRLQYAFRFLRYIVRERKNYDAVFVHMNPEYLVLGGCLWRLLGKKAALWYTHMKISWRLRCAARFADKIFTASAESCRLQSKKIAVVGHGIDTKLFKNRGAGAENLRLVTAGRIAPVKDLSTLIRGFLLLRKEFPRAEFSIAGEPITERDAAYFEKVKRVALEVRFLGGVSHDDLPRLYEKSSVFVHASRTGSMDKAALEALAAGMPVFTSSEAFSEEIPGVRKFKGGDPKDFAEKVSGAVARGELGYNEAAAWWVKERHDLARLAARIPAFLSES